MTQDKIYYNDLIAPHFDITVAGVFNHEYTHHYYSGGRGSGKSSKISLDIPLLIVQNPDCNALILRKVGVTLRDSVYSQILWAINVLGLSHKFKTTTSPLEITYKPTGQKIYFRGADEPVKIKSIKPQKGYIGITWFEELDQFNGAEEIRSILQSANRGGDAYWNFYSYNPPKSRDNWVNTEALNESEDTIRHHSTYETTPKEWLGEQFIFEAEKLKARNLTSYEHEYLGIATGTGGAVFDNIVERAIANDEMSRFDRLKFGIDFGFAVDPFAWGKMHYDKKRRTLYILDEVYEIKLSNRRAAEKIRQRHKGYEWITADSSEPKSISEMNGYGLRIEGAKKGPDSVEYGMKFLQDLDAIVIDKRLTPNAHKEFTLYEYAKNKDGQYISAYPDKNNHFIDLCRYALESEMIADKPLFTSNIRL